MRRVVVVSVLAVSVAVAACGGQAQQEFTRKDVEAVRHVPQALAEAYNERDTSRVAGLFADNSVFMPPNRPLLHGRQSLEEYFKGQFAQGATGLRLTSEDAGGHGSLAFVYGGYEMSYEPEEGRARRDRGKFLFVLRLGIGQNWRIEKAIWNSDLPPPAPTPAATS